MKEHGILIIGGGLASLTAANHLTATSKDALEIKNWSKTLDRKGSDSLYINSFKGSVRHCLATAGSLECVAALLQFQERVVFKNIKCDDIHPGIKALILEECIPREIVAHAPQIAAKVSFGFGDVNA